MRLAARRSCCLAREEVSMNVGPREQKGAPDSQPASHIDNEHTRKTGAFLRDGSSLLLTRPTCIRLWEHP